MLPKEKNNPRNASDNKKADSHKQPERKTIPKDKKSLFVEVSRTKGG
jgi:hypothetical protein